MRLATVGNVWYVTKSTLIPDELKLEVQERDFTVPPVVMSHCLQFLCYHHLDNIANRQQSLLDLYLTIKEGYFIGINELSTSLTILGVCNEIVGDKETAYHCYDTALQNKYEICRTAAKRKVGLFSSEATRRAPEGKQMIGRSGGMLPRNFSKKYEHLKRIFQSLNG